MAGAKWIRVSSLVGALGALAIVLVLSDCDSGHPESTGDGGTLGGIDGLTIDNFPRVDGSTSTLPLDRVIACELLHVPYTWTAVDPHSEATIVADAGPLGDTALANRINTTIVHSKTHQAFLNLIDGTKDLILVANEASPEEQIYADAKGVTLVSEAIALDALVILVNASNGVRDLTDEQVRDIYQDQIGNWNQVGGADLAIHPYLRPVNSGSQQLFDTIVMKGAPLASWPSDHVIAEMIGLVYQVSSDSAAIGYSVFYYLTYQHPEPGVATVAIDGVAPNATTIGDRSYPFTAEVWMVTRSDLPAGSMARRLHDWLLGPEGREVVRRSGYVPYVAPN